MAHITLSIPNETHRAMKKYPHIKWSEAARRGIFALLKQLQGLSSAEDILKELGSEFSEWVKNLDEHQAKKFFEAQRKMEWKTTKFLTRAR